MDPVRVDNVLNEEELSMLLSYIDSTKHLHENHPNLGRTFFHLIDLPDVLVDKITSIAKEKTKKNIKMTGRAFSTYTNKVGKPELAPHTDINDTFYIFDYQVSSNIDWPVIVEGVNYQLSDNSALIFSGKELVHWRPKKIFKDEEFLSMIFFHFIDLDDLESGRIYTDEEISLQIEKIMKKYSFYFEGNKG